MKQFIKALPVVLLTVMGSMMAADTVGRTFFLGNAGRTISNGLIVNAGRTHMPDQDAFNGVFSVQQHYSQNFNENQIGKYLFFNGTNSMSVRGTVNTVALPTDIFAPNFSIAGAFISTITVNPSVSSATTDLRLNVGLDEFMQGLHFNVSLPIVWTKFDAKLVETGLTAGTATFVAGTLAQSYFDAAGAPTAPYTNMIAAFKGNLTVTPTTNSVSETMNYGKIDGSRSETAVGNVVVELGYDFICKENAHLSVGIHGLFNGAAKSDAVYMFEPSIGTAGRHGVGGTVTGHVRLYEGESDDMNFTLHGSAQVTGVFDSVQKRSYDSIRHGVGSRYLQVKVETGTLPFAVNVSNHNANYINYSTLNAKIGLGALYDINLMVRYQNGGLCCDLGYTAWGHSAESHKGWVDAYTTNFLGAIAAGISDWTTTADRVSGNVSITGTQAGGTTAATTSGATAVAADCLTLADLNIASGLNPAAMSNTVFGNVGYEWMDSDWKPFIGAGAAGEFANDNTAFDQWHVFVNGGVSF